MKTAIKAYLYVKGADGMLDTDFDQAKAYGKVKAGNKAVFWKSGLRWYAVSTEQIQRIFRRVEPVYGKLCCGGRSYLIEWLVLVLNNGEELLIHIGDDAKKESEELMAALQELHPGLEYGKL